MLQERELLPLMERLLAAGYTLLLETSGERPLERVPRAVHKIVDVKCPGSGEGESFRSDNLPALGPGDEVKFVLADRADYDFARDFTRRHGLEQRVASVIFSPAFPTDAAGPRDAWTGFPIGGAGALAVLAFVFPSLLALVPLAVANGAAAELLLDPLPQLAADYGLVLSRMTITLVRNLADVNRVGEQMVKPAA